MTIHLNRDRQHAIDLAMRSGAYRDPAEVIGWELSMSAEDLEDGAVSEYCSRESRFSLAEVESELRSLGKLK